jgi:hypothetical protein
MGAYNLFRSNGNEALYCAVPEDRSVPTFVSGPAWEFTGKVSDGSARPLGFDSRAAATGARFNGFHLFPCFRGDVRAAR